MLFCMLLVLAADGNAAKKETLGGVEKCTCWVGGIVCVCVYVCIMDLIHCENHFHNIYCIVGT